jgi:hypothetical protein
LEKKQAMIHLQSKLTRAYILEVAALLFIAVVSYHLVSERITHARFPGGDEGSWMSVAAQLTRGEGFTTRWLEHPFLKPTTLPRPDDFRYPGLVVPLALAFKVFGISYSTALSTVAFVFFMYLTALYLVCRKAFGRKTALLTLLVSSISLLQLSWNTIVYSEGMFGLVVGLLILWTLTRKDLRKPVFWIVLGALCGLLYCVRPNGVLFAAGLAWLYWMERKKEHAFRLFTASLASMAFVMLPWMLRSWHCFGNPFHIATNAGLLRGSGSDPVTLSIGQFLSLYGVFYPFKAIAAGAMTLWKTLSFFEHGIQIIPLVGVVVGLVKRRRFYSPFAVASFGITFIACCYASHSGGSWAGLRYFTSLIPFVYGYGIAELITLAQAATIHFRRPIAWIAYGAIGLALCAPVYYPHNYYERTFRAQAPSDLTFKEHLKTLNALLGKKGTYFASSLSQLNFLTEYNCVGIQQFFDSTYVSEMVTRFSPTLVVVTQKEFQEPRIGAIMRAIERTGKDVTLVESNSYGLYWRIGAK